jgi:predicted nucleic acid-binding protein
MKEEKIYVVDTSVTAKLFLEEEYREKAEELYWQATQKKIILLAPELTCYELNNVLAKAPISLEEIEEHLCLFEEQVKNETLTVVPYSLEILKKAAEIANIDTQGMGHISSFDATFHALALLNNAVFLTADGKHYDKTKDLIGSILHLKDFS